jgi:hypothetical protein
MMALEEHDVRERLFAALDAQGPKRRVLAIPPDGTRGHARAGLILRLLHEYYGPALVDVMPALGTHEPMSAVEIGERFPGVPPSLFRVHDWRHDLADLGTVPADRVGELSEGRFVRAWPAQVNRLLLEGRHDLIVSIGQVVPHEVAGMANHAKNLFVGVGGSGGIHGSHFLGAAYGMERIMGRLDTPVRALFDDAMRDFGHLLPPVLWALTVVGPADPHPNDKPGGAGKPAGAARQATGAKAAAAPGGVLHGLFLGQGRTCLEEAAALSRSLNVNILAEPVKKALVFLDPAEFRSTWLGNKSIYRSRMALADGGELFVIAPGVSHFGEDPAIDRLIRRHGYRGTEATLAAVAADPELAANLSAAAHLIHGSSEGRFSVTLAAGGLSREEVEGAGFRWMGLDEARERFMHGELEAGKTKTPAGEELFYIPEPAAGLWSSRASWERTARLPVGA